MENKSAGAARKSWCVGDEMESVGGRGSLTHLFGASGDLRCTKQATWWDYARDVGGRAKVKR
jgi:hypothetical protein